MKALLFSSRLITTGSDFSLSGEPPEEDEDHRGLI
jgi:hypothetical protein